MGAGSMMDRETPIGRDTSALLLSGFGTELASPPRAIGGPVRDGVASPLMFVGALADVPDTASLPDVRLSMTGPPSRAARLIRQSSTLDIVWLAAVDTIEGEMLGDICAAVGERGCNLVCETSLAALDRVMAAIPASLSVQFLVDADPTDRLVALAAARRRGGHGTAFSMTSRATMRWSGLTGCRKRWGAFRACSATSPA